MYRKSVTGIKIHVLNLSLYIHKQNINFKSLNKMQKMIFSVIALVAFSFAGMANEVKEKKVETKTENKKVEKINVKTNCAIAYLEDFERLENLGLTFEAAGAIAFHNYQKCTGTT